MNLQEIEKKIDEIEEELTKIKESLEEASDEDVETMEKKTNELIATRKGLMEEKQKILNQNTSRKNILNSLASEKITAKTVRSFKDDEEVKPEDTKEYRTAFFKNLLGQKLNEAEQRAFLHTTENTGEVVPKELQNRIYSTMEENHPILKDVQILRTGVVISIVKHTGITAGDASVVNEGAAATDEENAFVEVSLSGKDFKKKIKFSYRLGVMAIPAFEKYLTKEIGDRLGAAMATEIVTKIGSDLAATNKFNVKTAGTLAVPDVLKGLSLLKGTNKVNIYCNSATFYGNIANIEGGKETLTFVNNLQENISGALLGKAIKEEDALSDGEVLIVDPSQFVFNVVQDIKIKKMEDEDFNNVLTGIAIAEGTLTNDKAGAKITVGIGG